MNPPPIIAAIEAQEADRQRERDINAAVITAFKHFGSPHDMTALHRMRWIAVVREEFKAQQFARFWAARAAERCLEAARTLSRIGHTKRKATISRTTEQLKSELARARG